MIRRDTFGVSGTLAGFLYIDPNAKFLLPTLRYIFITLIFAFISKESINLMPKSSRLSFLTLIHDNFVDKSYNRNELYIAISLLVCLIQNFGSMANFINQLKTTRVPNIIACIHIQKLYVCSATWQSLSLLHWNAASLFPKAAGAPTTTYIYQLRSTQYIAQSEGRSLCNVQCKSKGKTDAAKLSYNKSKDLCKRLHTVGFHEFP